MIYLLLAIAILPSAALTVKCFLLQSEIMELQAKLERERLSNGRGI